MNDLIEWLKVRDLRSGGYLSINAIEKDLKIPQSTISKAIHEHRPLPDKWIEPLSKALAKYGFKNKKAPF